MIIKHMKKIFLISVAFLLTFLIFPKIVSADCKIADWDENTRNLQVCVGEFDTINELRSTAAEVKCLGNSNGSIICRGIINPYFDLSSTPDSMIAQDSNGKYYTCPTVEGINRAIGKLEVSFTGGTNCTTSSIVTIPADWDLFSEGMPWDEGTNDPIKEGSPTCPDGKSINTAIGCIPINDTDAAIGVGGGIAFLLIVLAGFQIMTSAGNPDRLKAGQELMTSAIAGLILLIFSVFILRIIGVDILGLPGFGGTP
jgi:hypothetical protein